MVEDLLEKKLGKTIRVGGEEWVILGRKQGGNKPRYYLYSRRRRKYGSSLYLLTYDFAFFDLIIDGVQKFYIMDLHFDFAVEVKAGDRKEARRKAKAIAKSFSLTKPKRELGD